MEHSTTNKGRCLCGRVRLRVDSLNRGVVACHCTQCRQQTGHFVAATRAENKHLQVEGSEHLKWYRSSEQAERGFCEHCGSLLFWRRLNSEQTSIMAGCLERPTGLSLIRHIYTDDKGDYYDLEADIEALAQSD